MRAGRQVSSVQAMAQCHNTLCLKQQPREVGAASKQPLDWKWNLQRFTWLVTLSWKQIVQRKARGIWKGSLLGFDGSIYWLVCLKKNRHAVSGSDNMIAVNHSHFEHISVTYYCVKGFFYLIAWKIYPWNASNIQCLWWRVKWVHNKKVNFNNNFKHASFKIKQKWMV